MYSALSFTVRRAPRALRLMPYALCLGALPPTPYALRLEPIVSYPWGGPPPAPQQTTAQNVLERGLLLPPYALSRAPYAGGFTPVRPLYQLWRCRPCFLGLNYISFKGSEGGVRRLKKSKGFKTRPRFHSNNQQLRQAYAHQTRYHYDQYVVQRKVLCKP
jgi:hypothetical protein